MRYRIALCGFSEFEHRAMHFSFSHPAGFGESGFDMVDSLFDADFVVVDADSAPAVDGVVQAGRVGQSVFVGSGAPVGAASHLPRPIDTQRILRTLDDLTGRTPKAKEVRPKLGTPSIWDLPTLDDIVTTDLPVYDPEAVTEPIPLAPEATVAPPYEPPPPSAAELQSAAKTAARAAARRARLVTAAEGASAVAQSRDVLVLDADPTAGGELCALLERFGFRSWPMLTLPEVFAEIKKRPFAAMFLAIPLDEKGIAVLGEIHKLPVEPGRNAAVVFMVASQLHPSDRVRAALAGVGEPLVKPLQRGVVARALENHSIALPADARRT